jgi:hypothetical protein
MIPYMVILPNIVSLFCTLINSIFIPVTNTRSKHETHIRYGQVLSINCVTFLWIYHERDSSFRPVTVAVISPVRASSFSGGSWEITKKPTSADESTCYWSTSINLLSYYPQKWKIFQNQQAVFVQYLYTTLNVTFYCHIEIYVVYTDSAFDVTPNHKLKKGLQKN